MNSAARQWRTVDPDATSSGYKAFQTRLKDNYSTWQGCDPRMDHLKLAVGNSYEVLLLVQSVLQCTGHDRHSPTLCFYLVSTAVSPRCLEIYAFTVGKIYGSDAT